MLKRESKIMSISLLTNFNPLASHVRHVQDPLVLYVSLTRDGHQHQS